MQIAYKVHNHWFVAVGVVCAFTRLESERPPKKAGTEFLNASVLLSVLLHIRKKRLAKSTTKQVGEVKPVRVRDGANFYLIRKFEAVKTMNF